MNIPLDETDPEPPGLSVVVDGRDRAWQRNGGFWFAAGSSAFNWGGLTFPVTLVHVPRKLVKDYRKALHA